MSFLRFSISNFKFQIPNLSYLFLITFKTASASAIRCSMFDVRCSMFILFLLLPPLTQAIDGPLSPEDSLKYLKTEPGLKVELVAAEPMVVDPVAVAWDEKGRMYVVEDRGYPIGP